MSTRKRRVKASSRLHLRVTPRVRQAWTDVLKLERAARKQTASQLLGYVLMRRREYLIRQLREMGLDPESILHPGPKVPKVMPDSIDRPDPFI